MNSEVCPNGSFWALISVAIDQLLKKAGVGAELIKDPSARMGKRSGALWALYNEVRHLIDPQRKISGEEETQILVEFLERIIWKNKYRRGQGRALLEAAGTLDEEGWTDLKRRYLKSESPGFQKPYGTEFISKETLQRALAFLEAYRLFLKENSPEVISETCQDNAASFSQLDPFWIADLW